MFDRIERDGVGGAAMQGTEMEPGLAEIELPEAAEPAVYRSRDGGGVGARGGARSREGLRGVGARIDIAQASGVNWTIAVPNESSFCKKVWMPAQNR